MAVLLMVRPQRSYGRPGTAVFPAGWDAGLRPVAEGTQTAPCTIRKPGSVQTWSDELEQNVETPLDPYFTGRCRVQALTNYGTFNVAEQQVPVAGYLVTVPATVVPASGDMVTVTGTGDPMLDGRTLVIRDASQGTTVVERDLYCAFA